MGTHQPTRSTIHSKTCAVHAYTTNSELCVRVCSSAVIYLLPSIEQNIGNECMQKTIHSKRQQRPTATTTKRCWWWRQQQQRQLKAHTYIRIWNFLSVHKSWLCSVSRFHFKIELQGKAKSREEKKTPKWTNTIHSLTAIAHSSAQLSSTQLTSSLALLRLYIRFSQSTLRSHTCASTYRRELCVLTSREYSGVHSGASCVLCILHYILTHGFLYGECEYFILF